MGNYQNIGTLRSPSLWRAAIRLGSLVAEQRPPKRMGK